MSDEAKRLVYELGDAFYARRDYDERERAHKALLAYVERIERERDEARTILAHTDIGSLPHDWTLKQVAEARINDLIKLRDQVRDTCARAEKAEQRSAALEAENAALRALRDLGEQP